MNQIRCPHCGEVFTIDETNYNSIVKQIRDHEFNEELQRRENDLREKMNAQFEVVQSGNQQKANERMAAAEREFTQVFVKKDAEISELTQQIAVLREQLAHAQTEKESAVKETIALKENEVVMTLNEYKEKIAKLENDLSARDQEAKAQLAVEMEKKNADIALLNNQLNAKETEKQLAVQKAISDLKAEKDTEIQKYRSQLDNLRSESALKEDNMRSHYEEMISSRDLEIANQKELVKQYKDFKARQSTKMVGESLEQHCSYEFNKYRMTMFPKAYFEKDNDIRTGSKGDFIFRDYDEDGTEIISIMFEMKNENETTATKHKNEDFFRELDKDRNEKNCEYAVLVSMLEADSDLYNEGIVDVSYRYPKMYVVRPQFFIPIISILNNAAKNATSYKKMYLAERNNNLDIKNFEDNMLAFKDAFSKNYELASRKFQTAIEEIDKTIDHLQKTKDALLSSDRNLRLANNKAQDLSIKKLTRNAPSVAAKFEEIKKEKDQ
ncbi:MAG: DUF2130 domain-containing protein [Solobacterium sp.]|nr:DUF2130 domain-containing protein [Solobacterium sp.]